MEPKPMHNRLMRGKTAHVLISALIVGFVLAFGFTLEALDAVVKDACSSLAAIAAKWLERAAEVM
jgi:heme/copper-type cytochrome/quinol oxidase subunit 4